MGEDVDLDEHFQVLLESTTPLLHILGCLKLMRADRSQLFAKLGEKAK